MSTSPVFAFVRSADRVRAGSGRHAVSAEHVYPRGVTDALVQHDLAAGLDATTPPTTFAESFGALCGHVVGMMLCRPLHYGGPLQPTMPEQVIMQDFWLKLGIMQPVFHVQVIETVEFETPTLAVQHLGGTRPKALFFLVSEVSRERLLGQRTKTGETIAEVLARWRRRDDFHDTHGARLASAMFPPHALLCTCAAWRHFCFPVPESRAAGGSGLGCIKGWLDGVDRPESIDLREDGAEFEALSPELIQRLLALLSRMAASETGGPDVMDEIRVHADWLHNLRASMVYDAHLRGVKAYHMKHLFQCLVLSSYGKDTHDMLEMCVAAVRATVRQAVVREFYLEMLRQPMQIPSSTTLYRHRLTLHMAWCRWTAEGIRQLLEDSGGVCRWGTLDSSQQGNFDLLYSGSTTMLAKDLTPRFRDAMEIIRTRPRHQNRDDHDGVGLHARAQTLQESLVWKAGVPAGVGSGCGSLRHKLHALLHSLRLEAPSWRAAIELLNSTVTWTGDLGTESGIVKHCESARNLVGPWVVEDDMRADEHEVEFVFDDDPVAFADRDQDRGVDEAGFDFEDLVAVAGAPDGASESHGENEQRDDGPVPEYPRGLDPYELNFTKSVYIPGMLHIVSNATNDLGKLMQWWSVYVMWLTQVCRLLSRKWLRKRFFATCLSSPDAAMHQETFKGFNAHVHTGRWGSVLSAVAELLRVQAPLRRFWSAARFSMGGQMHEEDAEGGDHRCFRLHFVDAAIQSSRFWAYTDMVDRVGEFLEVFAHMSESCPCHGSHFRLIGPSRHLRRAQLRHDLGVSQCPLATRMAPEFAAGDLLKVLRRLTNVAQTMVSTDLGVLALSEEDRSVVLGDFAHARRHILFSMQLKTAFWRQLPWILFGLGHADDNTARECGARALQLFANAGDTATHHYVTLLMLGPGRCRDELLSYVAQQQPREALPLLERMCARFRFAAVSERWIEGRHAQAKAHLRSARNASAVHTAFAGWGRHTNTNPLFITRVCFFCGVGHQTKQDRERCGAIHGLVTKGAAQTPVQRGVVSQIHESQNTPHCVSLALRCCGTPVAILLKRIRVNMNPWLVFLPP